MAVRRGLNKGKGLEALFPQKKLKPSASSAETAEKRIPADKKSGSKTAEKSGVKPTEKTESSAVRKTADQPSAGNRPADPANGMTKTAKKTTAKNAGKTAATKAATKTTAREVSSKNTAGTVNTKNKSTATGAIELRLAEIVPNRLQPRKEFTQEAIDELAASIRQFGILQPLLVQKKGKYYELIAGERRWRAAKKAGLKTVPAIIREFTGQEAVEISLIENIQRENLNAIEEAQAYQRLQEEFRLTQEEMAKRVSKSRAAVANSLRLLKLDPSIQEKVISRELSMGHARALLALEKTEDQRLAAEKIISGRLSVRETEKLVKQILHPKKIRVKEKNEQLDAVYAALEEKLRKTTGTKVSINQGQGERGKIEIEYYSQDDLERIINLIG